MQTEELWIEFVNHINYLFTKIENDQYTGEDYMKGYNLCYNILTCRDGYEYFDKIYKIYNKSLSLYAINTILPKLQHKTGYQLVVEIDISYKIFTKISRRLNDIMMRLDNFIKHQDKLSLQDLSKVIFKEYVYKLIMSQDALKSNIDNNIFSDPILNQQLLIMYNDMKIDYKLPIDNTINQNFIIEI
jgi:hypothetical protein